MAKLATNHLVSSLRPFSPEILYEKALPSMPYFPVAVFPI